jgi:hypothetical protein
MNRDHDGLIAVFVVVGVITIWLLTFTLVSYFGGCAP